MTRICITGGPKTGKTSLARDLMERERIAIGCSFHTDDLMELGWSEASQAACAWLDTPGPWIVEGVAVSRALRKWRDQHPDAPPPVDRVIFLTTPHVERLAGQVAMARGVQTVHDEIEPWLNEHGITTEYR